MAITFNPFTGEFDFTSAGAGGGSDTFTTVQVDGVSVSTAAPILDFDGADFTLTESPTDDFDITIKEERIQDIAGAMFSGNTETLITATYQDADGTIDLVVDNNLANYSNATSNFFDTAGAGLTSTGSTANVGAGTGITVNADDVAINTSASLTWTGSHNFTGGSITVPTPSAADDAVTKSYADALLNGFTVKDPVRVATTANITLSGEQTIDGVSAVTGDRVLVKNQTTASANGIYVVAAGSWSRSTDADATGEVNGGMTIFVNEGTVNADSTWVLTTNDPIIVGTTNLTFTQFSGLGQVTAGDGLTKSGNTINVIAGTGISVAADSVSTNDSQIVHDNLSGFVANEHIDHTGVTLTAGAGLSGGGDISANRSFAVNINGQTSVAAATGDELLIGDVSDTNNIKKITVQSIIDLVPPGTDTFATIQSDGVAVSTGAPTLDFDSTDFTLTETPTDDFDITINDAGINHDATTNFVANEHIDHTSVTLTAGEGLTGGGDISASRSFALDFSDLSTTDTLVGATDLVSIHDGAQKKITFANFEGAINHDNLTGFVANEHINHTSVTLTAGSGLSGGGDISASRTFNVDITSETGVTAAAGDELLISDVSDLNNIKKITVQGIIDLVPGGTDTFATIQSDGVAVSTGAPTLDFDSSDFLLTETPTDDFDITVKDSGINHDATTNFVANEHIDHTAVTLTAGDGLTGGGDISASRSFALDFSDLATTDTAVGATDLVSIHDGAQKKITFANFEGSLNHDNLTGFVADEHIAHSAVTITAGSGLTGGGTIAASRTIDVGAGTGISVAADSVSINQAANLTWTGAHSFTGGSITVPTPTSSTQAANKSYVDGLVNGLDVKASVRVATTANITLSGTQTIDGVLVAVGNRVLVKDQTTASANGIYVVASGAWTRATDADTSAEVTAGMFTFVAEGTTNADSGWVLTTNDTITLGTTSLAFSQFSGAGQITAGDGLTKSGNTINAVAGTGITVAADSISTNDAQIVHDNLSGFVANEHIDHTSVTLTAGEGIAGGGDISASRSFALDFSDLSTTDTLVGATDLVSIHDGAQKKITFANFETALNHDNLTGFVANEHIDHTSVTLTAGAGLTGGGDISTNRSFAVNISGQTSVVAASADEILIADASDLSNIKKVTAQSIADLASGTDTFATIQVDGVAVSTGAPTLDFDGTDFTLTETPTDDFDITINDAGINHDATTNFVANEHIDHTSVTLTAGEGITGGGDISASRSFALDFSDLSTTDTAVGATDLVSIHDGAQKKITFANFQAGIDHTAITNIGTNTHAQIDTHIADSTVHFTVGSIDHGSITGLGDDDHTQYALLAGRSGGQILIGGTGIGDDLTLQSSSNATKGSIFFGAAGASLYDEVNDRLGVGETAPDSKVEIKTSSASLPALHVKAAASQTADILYVTDSLDADLVVIDSTGAVGIGTGSPSNSEAILEISSTTQGVLLPRMTTIQRDSIAMGMPTNESLLIYNTTNQAFEYWDGMTTWLGFGGETNTASNVGLGAGVFKQKTGVNLEFKSLTSMGGSLSISGGVDEIDLSVNAASIDHNSLMNYVANEHIDWTAGTSNNISIMGTISAMGITDSSLMGPAVMFASAGGAHSIDATNFVWDNTNKRLGIGEATPEVMFHTKIADAGITAPTWTTTLDAAVFESAGNTHVHILSPNTSIGAYAFSDTDARTRGALVYDHSTDLMAFYVSGGYKMWIDGSGQVGIGNNSPQRELHIKGAPALDGSDPIAIRLHSTRNSGAWTDGGDVCALEFWSDDLSGAGAGVRSKISMYVDGTTGAGYGLKFFTDVGAGGLQNVFRFDKDLRFQIAGPSSTGQGKFNVFCTSSSQRGIYMQMAASFAQNIIEIRDSTVTEIWKVDNSMNTLGGSGSAAAPAYSYISDPDTGVFSGGTNILALSTAGVEAMRIDANGNVGIGTTSPNADLDVTGTDSIIVPNGTTAQRNGSPENGMIRYNSDNSRFEIYENSAWINLKTSIATINETQTSGTNGGTFTSGSWQTRTLNTLVDPYSIVTSLATNRFTLPAGVYYIEINAPAFAVQQNKVKLVADPAGTPSDALIGESSYSSSTSFSAKLVGILDISASTTYEVQHRCTATRATDGFGPASSYSVSEIYTQVKIAKIGN